MANNNYTLPGKNPFNILETIGEVRELVSDYPVDAQGDLDTATTMNRTATYHAGLRYAMEQINSDREASYVFGDLPSKYRLPLKWLCAKFICDKRAAAAVNDGEGEDASETADDDTQTTMQISSPGFSLTETEGGSHTTMHYKNLYWQRQSSAYFGQYQRFLNRIGEIRQTKAKRDSLRRWSR